MSAHNEHSSYRQLLWFVFDIPAKNAFATILEKAPLHQEQIAFLDEVVGYLVKNGIMEPKVLFDTPFTHHHTNGVAGIFGDAVAKEVVNIVEEINNNAEVA